MCAFNFLTGKTKISTTQTLIATWCRGAIFVRHGIADIDDGEGDEVEPGGEQRVKDAIEHAGRLVPKTGPVAELDANVSWSLVNWVHLSSISDLAVLVVAFSSQLLRRRTLVLVGID